MPEKNVTTKICTDCLLVKDFSEFSNRSDSKDRLYKSCKECIRRNRLFRERTKKGVALMAYSNQVEKSKRRGHAPPNYTKSDFIDWLLSKEKFHIVYDEWISSGYLTNEKPSCDRLDDYLPYTFNNLQIMTWKENNSKANSDRKNGINNKVSIAVIQTTDGGLFVATHHSMIQAQRVTGVRNGNISRCCSGKAKTAGGFKWAYA